MDDSKDLSTWERGAPAPQCLSQFLERQSGAGAPRSRERGTSFLQDLVLDAAGRFTNSIGVASSTHFQSSDNGQSETGNIFIHSARMRS